MLESLLDDIPQLGEARRKALLEKFGSVTALRKAELGEIASIPGIGEKTASLIEAALAQQFDAHVNTGTGEILS